MCVCSHVLFINTCFASVCLFVGFITTKLVGWWAGVPGGLVTRIHHCHYSELTISISDYMCIYIQWASISGWRTEILLQATAGWAALGQVHFLSVLFQWIISCGCIVVFRVKPWWIFTYCPFCSSFKVEQRFKFKYRKITNFITKLYILQSAKGTLMLKELMFVLVESITFSNISGEVPFYM